MAGDDSSGAESAPPGRVQDSDLDEMLKKLESMRSGGDDDRYLEEAMGCLRAGSNSATVVMCWNVLVLAIRKKIGELEPDKIQIVLKGMGPRTGSSIASIHDLAKVADADLVRLGEKIGLYDLGVAQRLDSMREVRNAAAHVSQAVTTKRTVHAFVDDVHRFAGIVSRARLAADGPLLDRLAALDPPDLRDEVNAMPRPLAASCAKRALSEVVATAARESPRAESLLGIATACIRVRCTDDEKLEILRSLSPQPRSE